MAALNKKYDQVQVQILGKEEMSPRNEVISLINEVISLILHNLKLHHGT